MSEIIRGIKKIIAKVRRYAKRNNASVDVDEFIDENKKKYFYFYFDPVVSKVSWDANALRLLKHEKLVQFLVGLLEDREIAYKEILQPDKTKMIIVPKHQTPNKAIIEQQNFCPVE